MCTVGKPGWSGEAEGQQSPAGECLRAEAAQAGNRAVDVQHDATQCATRNSVVVLLIVHWNLLTMVEARSGGPLRRTISQSYISEG